jgi:hypothetical protein
MAKALLDLLAGGDRRSIGHANQVVAAVLHSPGTFPQLIKGLRSADSRVRMRAADAVEKISREKPELLRPYKKELLGLLHETAMKQRGRPRAELRCHRSRSFASLRISAGGARSLPPSREKLGAPAPLTAPNASKNKGDVVRSNVSLGMSWWLYYKLSFTLFRR